MSNYAFVTDPVARAVCEEDAARVRELVSAGASLDQADEMMGPPLQAAIQNEDHEMVELLLELGANPDGPTAGRWDSPLSMAALNRDIKSVKLLLDKGANVNLMRDDSTPLMSAMCENDVKIAKLLIDAGADVFATNSHGASPANSMDVEPPGAAMVKLIETAARNSTASAGLGDASRYGATQRVLELLGESNSDELLAAAGIAVQHDQSEVLQALLAAGIDAGATVPLGSTDRYPMPLLHLAVYKGHDEVITVLLEAGADPNQTATIFDHEDTTPLMLAAQDRNLARVKKLLAAGADPRMRNREGETALSLARKDGGKSIIKYLETLAAKQSADEGDADMNLHDAVRDGRVDLVNKLLAAGSDANQRDKEKYTPLMAAITHDNPEMVALLLQHGADPCVEWPRPGGSTWAFAMRQTSAVKIARLLLDGVEDPATLAASPSSYYAPPSALWAAVFDLQKKAGPIATMLLERGLDPNGRFADGFTPLLIAAMRGSAKSIDAVQVLLDAGADAHIVKEPDPAALERRRQIVEEMRERGLNYAPRSDADTEPQSVLELARQHSKKVYQTIRAHVGGKLDAYDQTDVILAELKSKAAESWFIELKDELAKQLRCQPRAWRRRAGVLHFSAKLGRLPEANLDDDSSADDGDDTELLRLEPLQALARERGASLVYTETPGDARKVTRLLLAPTPSWIAMLRMCGVNGANYGLRNRDIIAWLRERAEQHPFELQGCGHDFVAIRFTDPIIDDHESLHKAILSFCPDASGDSPEDPGALRDFYARDRRCFLWWD